MPPVSPETTDSIAYAMLGYVCDGSLDQPAAEALTASSYEDRSGAIKAVTEACQAGKEITVREDLHLRIIQAYLGAKLVKLSSTTSLLTKNF